MDYFHSMNHYLRGKIGFMNSVVRHFPTVAVIAVWTGSAAAFFNGGKNAEIAGEKLLKQQERLLQQVTEQVELYEQQLNAMMETQTKLNELLWGKNEIIRSLSAKLMNAYSEQLATATKEKLEKPNSDNTASNESGFAEDNLDVHSK